VIMEDNDSSSNKKSTPSSARKVLKKRKPKDKPKRPLSAYNFFFKEERKKIINTVWYEEGADPNDLIPDLSTEQISKLKKDTGKVSFEEMGKVIGRRWRDIKPERLTYYTSLSEGDAERYKKEMKNHNERKEEMRNRANISTAQINYATHSQSHLMPPSMHRYPEMPAPSSGMYGGQIVYMPPHHMEPNASHGHEQMPIMGGSNLYYSNDLPPTTEGQFRNAPPPTYPDNSSSNYAYGSSYYPTEPSPSLRFPPRRDHSYLSEARNNAQYPSYPQQNHSQTSGTSSYQTSYPQHPYNADNQDKGW